MQTTVDQVIADSYLKRDNPMSDDPMSDEFLILQVIRVTLKDYCHRTEFQGEKMSGRLMHDGITRCWCWAWRWGRLCLPLVWGPPLDCALLSFGYSRPVDLTDLTRSTILSLMESVALRISLSLNAAELWTMGSAMQVFLWKRVQKR